MTDKVLLNSGYKEIEKSPYLFPFSTKMFQKRITDKKGKTKYFIEVGKYDDDYEYNLSSETYYGCVRVHLYGINLPLTIEEIEQEIDKIWTRGDFNYYESE